MLPANLVGILVFFAAIFPGFAWVRVAETRALRASRSPLMEMLELASVGATCSIAAAACMGGLTKIVPVFADLDRWATDDSYFRNNQFRVLLTVVVVLGMSTAISWFAARVVYRNQPRVFGPERTVWTDVLAESGRTLEGGMLRVAFLAVRLSDDRLIEGYLYSFPAGNTDTVEEVALRSPIFVRDSPTMDRVRVANIEYIIVRTSEVKEISVSFEDVEAA